MNEVNTYGAVTKRGTIFGVKNCTLFEGNDRKLVWEGEGTDVRLCNSAYEVLKQADLNYLVKKEPLFSQDGLDSGLFGTRRYELTEEGLEVATPYFYGAVGNKYKVVQNSKAMEFLDELYCHEGFSVETAGQFENGKIMWIEARLPERFMVDEKIVPYIVFTNRHDGQGTIKVCLTPIRVVCKNTLAYSIAKAARTFNIRHTESAESRLAVAKETLQNYAIYLENLQAQIEKQKSILLTDTIVDNMLKMVFPIKKEYGELKVQTISEQRQCVKYIYENAPDLQDMEQSAFRFVSAVSDFATHSKSNRAKEGWHNRLFQNSLDGVELVDIANNVVEAIEPYANKVIGMA